jgi:hypothetical protein
LIFITTILRYVALKRYNSFTLQQARALFVEMGMAHHVKTVDGNIARVQAKLAGGG